jgi:hypothetical protein
VQVYTRDKTVIRGVAFFAYATPRAPDISLVAPLRAAMVATSEGHVAGHGV